MQHALWLAGVLSLLVVMTLAARPDRPLDYVHVPGGKLFHKDCVHGIPDGAHLETDSLKNTKVTHPNGETQLIPPCPYPVLTPGPLHGPAWKAWTEFNNTQPVTKFSTQWGIPPNPPSYTGQILYYWNGIEPAANTAVLQPVLQFGATPAGGGQYWAVASWYVSDVTATYSKLLACPTKGNPSVIGTMSVDSSGKWTVTGVCGGTPTTLQYTPPDRDYTWAYPCVLEAYDVDDCKREYPTTDSLTFSNIQLWVAGNPVTPTWKPQTKNNQCNEHATVTSTSQVAILWN